MAQEVIVSDSPNIPQMRETIERQEKKIAELESERNGLQSDLRVRDARDAFRTAGYDPRQGDLFAASNPDAEINAENVQGFADQYNLSPAGDSTPTDEGDPTPEVDDGSAELNAMAGGGSRGGDGGAGGAASEPMSRAEWQRLYESDPAAAKAAVASGRVEISRDNPYVQGSGLPRGVNPYAEMSTD